MPHAPDAEDTMADPMQPDPAAFLAPLLALAPIFPAHPEVWVTDCTGRTVLLGTVLPGRRQLAVFKQVGRVVDRLRARGGSEAAAGMLLQLDVDEELIGPLAAAFAEAWPEECAGVDPLDRFPIEEMLAAIMPVVGRFLRNIAVAVRQREAAPLPG